MPTDTPTWEETTDVAPSWEETAPLPNADFLRSRIATQKAQPPLPVAGLPKQIWQGLTKPVPFSEMVEDVNRPLPGIRPIQPMAISKDAGVWETVGKEAYNVATSIPNFIATPGGVAATMTGGASGAVGKALASGFAALGVQGAGKAVLDAYPNWQNMTKAEKTKAVVDVGANLAMSGAMVKGGTAKVEPFKEPPVSGASLKMPAGAVPKFEDTTPVGEPEAPAATPTPSARQNAPQQAPQGQIPPPVVTPPKPGATTSLGEVLDKLKLPSEPAQAPIPTTPAPAAPSPAPAQEGVKEPGGLKPSTKKMFEDEIAKGTPTPIDKESQSKFKPNSPVT